MILATDSVGLAKPAQKLRIQVGAGGESEGVQMVAWGKGLHPAEAWVVNASRENQVPVQPVNSRLRDRE